MAGEKEGERREGENKESGEEKAASILRFAYKLALELGIHDVEEYPDGLIWIMSWQQFLGWIDYNTYEPFGAQRDDFRFGMLASVFAEPNRDRKKRSQPFSPRDFMFFTHEHDEEKRARRKGGIMDAEGWKVFKTGLKRALGLEPESNESV